jgi:hypothetical protein
LKPRNLTSQFLAEDAQRRRWESCILIEQASELFGTLGLPKYGQHRVDKGAEYYERRKRQQQIESLRKKARLALHVFFALLVLRTCPDLRPAVQHIIVSSLDSVAR